MAVETLGHGILDVRILRLIGLVKSDELVVSDQLGPQLLHAASIMSRVTIGHIMVVQTALVSNLMRNELSMVSRGNALVNELRLFGLLSQISGHKLSHLHVVREHVDGQLEALSDGDDLLLRLVLFLRLVDK